jgi:hypothetical protein
MKIRKVKRQAGSGSTCKPVTTTATATATGSSIASSASSAVSSSVKSNAPSTTSKAQGTSAPASSSAKASTTSSAPKPAATNFTVDPDGNGPFKGQATCEFLFSLSVCQRKEYEKKLIIRLRYRRRLWLLWSLAQKLRTYSSPFSGING